MKRILTALAAALLSVVALVPAAFASGTTANVSWTAPTQYTDGTTLPASDIDHYTINACEVNSPATCVTSTVKPPATASAMAVVCGQYDFTIIVTTTATAIYPNTTSSPSSVVPYASGVSCLPKAVTGLTVN